jgi:hypothetical protein
VGIGRESLLPVVTVLLLNVPVCGEEFPSARPESSSGCHRPLTDIRPGSWISMDRKVKS